FGEWSAKVAFAPNGQYLAYGAGAASSYIGLRRASDGGLLWQTNAHSDDVKSLAFSEDGRLLVSVGSRSYYNAGAETRYPSIILWNPADGSRRGIVPTLSASVTSVVLPRGGTNL